MITNCQRLINSLQKKIDLIEKQKKAGRTDFTNSEIESERLVRFFVRLASEAVHYSVEENISEKFFKISQCEKDGNLIGDMKDMDILWLPHQTVLVESKVNTKRRERSGQITGSVMGEKVSRARWYFLIHQDKTMEPVVDNNGNPVHREFLVMIAIQSRRGFMIFKGDFRIGINYEESEGWVWKGSHNITSKEHEKASDFMMVIAWVATSAMLTMFQTQGIETEEVLPNQRQNALRKKRGKPPYRGVTRIRVGRVYNKTGEACDNVTPKAMHLRRGHIRRQRFGPGNSLTKKIFIQPCMVNYNPDANFTPSERMVS